MNKSHTHVRNQFESNSHVMIIFTLKKKHLSWGTIQLRNCYNDIQFSDLAYITVFGITRGIHLYPGLQFGSNTSDAFRGMITAQTFISSSLQSVPPSPSSSYPEWRNDTDRHSISAITEDWNNTTTQSTQSTTKQFLFQIPNNNITDQDFKSLNFDTTMVGNTLSADSNQVRQNPGASAATTTTTTYNIIDSTVSILSPDQIACARYEYAEAQRLVPKPSCTCPPGQMPSGEHGACKSMS